MSRLLSIAVSTGIIGTGMLAWAFAGRPLLANPDLHTPVNPLGIQRSPYGEVFAMALQGPIDAYFNAGMFSETHPHQEGQECPLCASPKQDANPAGSAQSIFSLSDRLQNLLTFLDQAAEARTNPKPASDALKRHLRRQSENKLRFAYQLDPAHYANYNSLHFFLTEPAVGTRPELTPSAAKLAEETIQYCLKQEDDPRPALTAAAACTNILHLMFNDSHNATPKFTTMQMRQYLNRLDYCIARYDRIAREWDLSKNWDLLSPQRINECQERYSFICKIRDAASQTIVRIEQKSLSAGVRSSPASSVVRSPTSDTHITSTHSILASLIGLQSPPHISLANPDRPLYPITD